MAKRARTQQFSASFHTLSQRKKRENDPSDVPFGDTQIGRLISRIKNTSDLDLNDDDTVRLIKLGYELPFLEFECVRENTYFGRFEAAYYGSEYRNSRLGTIDPDSLNLRKFYYLVDIRRDGRIVVGTQYAGNYGDYDGLRKCFQNLLSSAQHVPISRTIASPAHELRGGEPIEVTLRVRKPASKAGAPALFSTSSSIAVTKQEYGDQFGSEVLQRLGPASRGNVAARKKAIAKLVNEGELIEVNDEDISACSVLVREEGRQRTVYLLGDSKFATKFPIKAEAGFDSHPNRDEVKEEMLRLLEYTITPLI